MVESAHKPGLWPAAYEPLRALGGKLAEWLAPASEASTDGSAYTIVMELPGVAESDIDIAIENGVITVTGEKKTEKDEKGETWYFSERQYGAFSRSFRLPPDADQAKLTADLKDGVLTIRAPKTSPAAEKPRKLKIKTV